jgi:holo-[acyl-carrier protein] synthase
MIYGIGTDICDVRRIAATYARRGERFAERVLGERELAIFHARRARVETRGISFLATRFSAKEAFSKAIGMGMRMPMTWRDCEVLNAPSGKPEIRLSGALAAWFEARHLNAQVSLSDETDYAVSFVVIEQKEAR